MPVRISKNRVALENIPLNEAKGSDIASAATTNIWVTNGNTRHITGTTTITSFGTAPQAGAWVKVIFDGALTLTHGANLNLPGSANIVTAADDFAFIYADTTTQHDVLYFRKNGNAITSTAGTVVQVVNTQTGAMATGTTAIPHDDTIPQNTEGDQYMSLAITPSNTNNKLRIDVVVSYSNNNAAAWEAVALFQDATANALATVAMRNPTVDMINVMSFTHYMTAGTTSATTFKVRMGGDVGTTTFNGRVGARYYGGVLASSITITEIQG